MKKDLKKHLLNKLYTGHHHQEMKEWSLCAQCGKKQKEWDEERGRLKKLHPQEFIRKDKEYKPSEKLQEKADQLKKSEDYRNFLRHTKEQKESKKKVFY